MTRHVLPVILSLSVIGMTASNAFAQSSQIQNSTSRRAVEATAADTIQLKIESAKLQIAVEAEAADTLQLKIESAKLQITEDIEIMRRLLDATVKELYSTASWSLGLTFSHPGSSGSSEAVSPWNFRTSSSKSKTPQSPANMAYSYLFTTGTPGKTTRNRNLPIRESIGTYLNKHGIVYQLELPPLSEPAKPVKTEKKKTLADCPFMSLSKWDRTRKHLSGELKKINCSECHADKNLKSSDAYFKSNFSGSSKSKWITNFVVEKPSASVLTRAELTERLIDLLAENGHHIRVLTPPEHLTLAVTFREPLPAPQATPGMGSMMGGMSSGSMSSAGVSGGSAGTMFGMGSSGIRMSVPPHIPQGTPVKRSPAKPSSQNQPRKKNIFVVNDEGVVIMSDVGEGEAEGFGSGGFGGVGGGFGGVGSAFGGAGGGFGGTSATVGNEQLAGDLYMRQGNFKKAAEEYQKAINKLKKSSAFNPTLHQKLTAALLRVGDIDRAKVLFDKLMAFEKSKRSSRPKQPEKPAVSLPARLVISVTKANLDAVAAGKISREEFRKQVSIDYFDPASVKPKAQSTQTKDTKN